MAEARASVGSSRPAAGTSATGAGREARPERTRPDLDRSVVGVRATAATAATATRSRRPSCRFGTIGPSLYHYGATGASPTSPRRPRSRSSSTPGSRSTTRRASTPARRCRGSATRHARHGADGRPDVAAARPAVAGQSAVETMTTWARRRPGTGHGLNRREFAQVLARRRSPAWAWRAGARPTAAAEERCTTCRRWARARAS